MTDTLAEKLRQITADDNDEADILFEAADRLEELEAVLQTVMVGGNHLACVIGPDHLPKTATYSDALEHYGAGNMFDVWCCWKTIMLARAALEGKDGQTV